MYIVRFQRILEYVRISERKKGEEKNHLENEVKTL
jgi:hypothetical protein